MYTAKSQTFVLLKLLQHSDFEVIVKSFPKVIAEIKNVGSTMKLGVFA